jgi:tetratricopeptide (TPR) repeat protein
MKNSTYEKGISLYKNGKMFENMKKYSLMEKYYIDAVTKYKNTDALISLINYYESINDEKNLTKYINVSHESEFKNKDLCMWHYQISLKNGNQENQEKYLKFAIEYGSVEAMYFLGEMYTQKGVYNNVDEYLIYLSENNNNATIELIKKYKNSDVNKWIYYCLRAKEQNNYTFIFDLAMYYKSSQQFDKMEEILLFLIYKEKNKESFEEVKKYYFDTKQYEKLMKIYESQLKIEPNNQNIIINIAKLYEILEKYESCESYYISLIIVNNIDAMIEFALYYKNRNNIEEMIRYLNMAARRDCSRAYLLLGHYYKNNNNIDKMEENYTWAAILHSIDAMIELIKFYSNNNDKMMINRWYNSLLKETQIENMNIETNLMIGNALEKLGDYVGALQIYNKINNTDAIFRIGIIYLDEYRDLEKAYDCFSIIIDKNYILYSDSVYNLGFISELKNNYDEMEKYYIKAIEANFNREAIFRLSLYNLSIKKDYNKAKDYALLAIEKHNDIRCMEIAGNCSYLLKEYNDIEKYYLQIYNINKNIERVNIKLGSFYEIINKELNTAIKYYKLCDNNFSHILNKCEIIEENNDCGICCDEMKYTCKLNVCCNQTICIKCLKELLDKKDYFKCPFCRYQINFNNTYYLDRYGIKYGESIEDVEKDKNGNIDIELNQNNNHDPSLDDENWGFGIEQFLD